VHITVVGAGVIGLTTALALEEHGHTVQVVAATTGAETTSDVAGAVWFPYRAGPPAKVAVWAARTRSWLEPLAGDPATGVDMLTGYEITTDDGPSPPRPWWAAAIDVDRAPAPVTGAPIAWRFAAPRVEPARFLPWLTARLRAPIDVRTVTDLAAEPGDLVVNCTGLGARALVPDEEMTPLFGQIVVTAPGTVDRAVTITDHRDPDAIFYVIPRRDELVLGGVSRPWPPGAPIARDAEVSRRILAQAAALGLPIGAVLRERIGLRPYRPEVRLEREGRILHNYGHGGAGFTLAWGCAEEVVALARETRG
jgi:D-amino-acid oxidase